MKLRVWLLPLSLVAGAAVGLWLAWPQRPPAATQVAAPVKGMAMKAPVASWGVGERAPYRTQGNTVFVNNRICAVSHSPLDPNKLGQFVSRVEYDGPIEEFKGKTLVFNQCCKMCIQKFPSMWRSERNAILRFHGLTASR